MKNCQLLIQKNTEKIKCKKSSKNQEIKNSFHTQEKRNNKNKNLRNPKLWTSCTQTCKKRQKVKKLERKRKNFNFFKELKFKNTQRNEEKIHMFIKITQNT